MTKMAMLKLATSTLVLGTTMVGCAMSGQAQRPAALSDARAVKVAAKAAASAGAALAKHRAGEAVGFAEAAVAAQPRDAGYRMLLGQAYLAAGRFQSAETSFSDTLTLDPNRERAALNLALAQTALGKTASAKSTLAQYREKLPAADFGLATALAGDAPEAVRVLEYAARQPDADAKTRQNLALAYAFAGQWSNARTLATQDLSPTDADARILEWMTLVRPVAGNNQVAKLLNVTPASDPGQPTGLALNTPAAPVQTAQAEPLPPPVATDPVAIEMATNASSAQPAPAYEVPTTDRAVPTFTRVETPRAAIVRKLPVVAAIGARSMPARVAARVSTPGKFMIQLGAFSSNAAAAKAWAKIEGRYRLNGRTAFSGAARYRNANLVRVAVGGFASLTDADRLCGQIRASRGTCFVRPAAGDRVALWNSPAVKFAAR